MASKITQKDIFQHLITLVETSDFSITKGEETLTAEEIVKRLQSKIDGLDKKSSAAKSKSNEAKDKVKEQIISVLTGRMKVTPLTKSLNETFGTDYTVQKITSMLSDLVLENRVIRTTEKKDTFYALPEDEE